MFESENRKSSNVNRKIEIGIIEAEIRIEATQLTRRIVTALVYIPRPVEGWCTCGKHHAWGHPKMNVCCRDHPIWKRWMRIWYNSSTFDAWWRLRTYRNCWSQPHCGYTFKTIAVIMVSTCCYNVDMLAKTIEFFYQYKQMNLFKHFGRCYVHHA